jgi:glycine dehydrogenase
MNKRYTLDELKMRGDFIRRHIGPGEPQISEMLEALSLGSLDELIDKAVPGDIILDQPLALEEPKSERMTLSTLRQMAARNRVFISMIGMGYYGTVTPTVILRNVVENPGWYTAYTPYQAEVSQGRLEALLTFQQMVMDLTAMELANASLLDEATAAAEAMALAKRVAKSKSMTFFVDRDCHPQTLAVLRTRARHFDFEIIVGDPYGEELDQHDVFGVLVQYPGSTGGLRDISDVVERVHQKQALAVVAADLLSLCLLKPPGEMGADVVIGSAQRFGVPMGFGGPHAAFFATREAYKRQVPGRIIGVSVDAQGRPALRMALQTREQHIRREKATSNICTAQVLLAVVAALYAVYHGPDGLRLIAGRVHRMACIAAEGLRRLGFEVVTDAHFDTIRVRVPGQAGRLVANARESRINLRLIDADHLGISFDETTKRANLEALWRVFSSKADRRLDIMALDAEVEEGIPAALRRESEFLTHSVFHLYHAETEMLRYLRWLAAKDLALDRAMIPLGSCTMKLNATTEMIPITWRNFSAMHPFAPHDQTLGYQQLFEELEEMLCAVTGFDAVSHSQLGARHKSGLGHHGWPPGGGGRLRRPGQYRPCGPEGQGGRAQGPSLGSHDHLSLHSWCLRGAGARGLQDRPRSRRPGLSGRGQPERHAGGCLSGRNRRRRLAYEPAQDLLHTSWRRWARGGAHRRPGPSGALPARSPGGRGGQPFRRRGRDDRRGSGCSLGLGLNPADILGLHHDDGA